MKVINGLLIIALLSITINIQGKMPDKPKNVFPDATWHEDPNTTYWVYDVFFLSENEIVWYPNGGLKVLRYTSNVDSSRVMETYYENGSLKKISRIIQVKYLKEYSDKVKNGYSSIRIGPQIEYYSNGRIKEYKCYMAVAGKGNNIEEKLVGKEYSCDENGNETKYVEHELVTGIEDKWPRYTVEMVIEKIKKERRLLLVKRIDKSPFVGKIISIGDKSREIVIEFNKGYELVVADSVGCLVGENIVEFVCTKISDGKGWFVAREDAVGKYQSITLESKPRFFKANDIKYKDIVQQNRNPKVGDTITIDGIPFVYIPSEDSNNSSKSSPDHIQGFWMTKYEITVGDYIKFHYESNITSNQNRSRSLPQNKVPLEFNSRYPVNLGKYSTYAYNFCIWFSRKHGIDTELPTGQEWKYAARGGTKSRYYWGNDHIGKYCWYMNNSGGKLHPVGEKLPNGYGLYDIIGNVWEWTGSHADTLRGGSCGSYERDLQYDSHIYVNFEHTDEVGDTNAYSFLNTQGTSFRMIIRVPNK